MRKLSGASRAKRAHNRHIVTGGNTFVFTSRESVTDVSGRRVDFPQNTLFNTPPCGAYLLFSATVTYYPNSRTRTGFEDVQFYAPENFPVYTALVWGDYQGPQDL